MQSHLVPQTPSFRPGLNSCLCNVTSLLSLDTNKSLFTAAKRPPLWLNLPPLYLYNPPNHLLATLEVLLLKIVRTFKLASPSLWNEGLLLIAK